VRQRFLRFGFAPAARLVVLQRLALSRRAEQELREANKGIDALKATTTEKDN
jgi:hypothetical protein